ncbi:MAG: hypothetical protein BWY83_02999 [bacterium ADurb.Bin478]|nr:MAG: hypothetical protein BWY83_02999 [bacterium ADurb.Bin478]
MLADRTAEKDLIPGLQTAGAHFVIVFHDADACGVDEQSVSLAVIHHFGVAGHDAHARFFSRSRHGLQNTFQFIERQPLFQYKTDAEIERPGAAHAQIIDRAVDREISNVAAREKNGLHHIAVRGKGDTAGVYGQRGRVIALLQLFADQVGVKKMADQIVHHTATAAVRHLHGKGWSHSRRAGAGFFLLFMHRATERSFCFIVIIGGARTLR